MSVKSITAYHENRETAFKPDEEKVLDLIKKKPRINGLGLEYWMKKKFHTFSGRLTSLRRKGLIYILEGEGKYSQFVYEPDPDRQKELSSIYEREKTLSDFRNFVRKYAHILTPSGKAALQATYDKVEADLTETEKQDLITQNLIG